MTRAASLAGPALDCVAGVRIGLLRIPAPPREVENSGMAVWHGRAKVRRETKILTEWILLGFRHKGVESLNTKRRCKQVKFCCGCINGLGQRSFEVN